MMFVIVLIIASIVAAIGGIGSLMVFLFALIVAMTINWQRNSP